MMRFVAVAVKSHDGAAADSGDAPRLRISLASTPDTASARERRREEATERRRITDARIEFHLRHHVDAANDGSVERVDLQHSQTVLRRARRRVSDSFFLENKVVLHFCFFFFFLHCTQ
jgi:hypothetical protein